MAAERFVKDVMTREESAGRIAADQRRHVGWESLCRQVRRLAAAGHNELDCGIFMLTSMRLVRNGLCPVKGGLHTGYSHTVVGKEAPG